MANFDYEDIVITYLAGKTATISGSIMTQTGADFADVTDNTDYVTLTKGTLDTTGDVIGRYLITAHTTDTLTMAGYTLGASSGGNIYWEVPLSANLNTATELEESILLDLRRDVDYLGEQLSMTGSNWTDNNYDWTVGTTDTLSTDELLHMTYISDLRAACQDLYTNQSLGTITWTISSLTNGELYDVSNDIISGNKGTAIDPREDSLYEDIRTAILTVASTVFYYVDAVAGNDSTGDGSASNPYKTWNKAVTVLNAAGSGNLFFQAGTYTMNIAVTAANTHIRGSALGEAIFNHDLGTSYIFSSVNGIILEQMHFRITTSNQVGRYAIQSDNMTVTECLFSNEEDVVIAVQFAVFGLCGNLAFSHCSFLGTPTSGGDRIERATILASDTDTTFTDCNWLGFDYCIRFGSSANATVTDCGFYDYIDKYLLQTPTEAGTIWTSDPLILDRANGHLASTSPYINQASDGFDIGAWIDSPYNTIQSIAESLTLADVATEKITDFVNESLTLSEDVEIANFNINIDMFGGGLLNTTSTGVATYLSSSDITPPPESPNFQYDGAFIDLSFDNASGNQMKVYIVHDDEVTDYEDVAWWIINGTFPAATTSLTYAINCTIDSEVDDEFGENYEFSTVTADGDNNQQADLKLKLRIHNVSLDIWSEVVSISKTYYLNDFMKSMFYCADNPRMVDGEYANHANYYAQTFHTGTNKYTRSDSVDWIDDDRRFAYNPMYKAEKLIDVDSSGTPDPYPPNIGLDVAWRYRYNVGSELTINGFYSEIVVYACMVCNFGNWNYNSLHNFDTSLPLTELRDAGTANFSSPVMGSGTGDIRYIQIQATEGSDCSWHSSHSTAYIYFPSGEIIGWGTYAGHHNIITPAELFFEQADTPWSACLPKNYYYMEAPDTQGFYPVPNGNVYYPYTYQEIYLNVDHTGDHYNYALSKYKSHQGTAVWNTHW